MKTSVLVFGAICSAVATNAWEVQFHTRSNIGWNTHGIKDVDCQKINWSSGKAQEDVSWINFDEETDLWVDPDDLTVYPGSDCGAGGVTFKPGVNKSGKGFLVGSYSVH